MLLTLFNISCSAPAQQAEIRRTELQRYDLSAGGFEAIQVRIDFDPHTVFGNHYHPGEEIIYVLEGMLEYKVEGIQTTLPFFASTAVTNPDLPEPIATSRPPALARIGEFWKSQS